jgi:hypothetical protein
MLPVADDPGCAGSDELKLTHEFLATMLGVRRPTIAIVVGELEKAGLILNGNRGAIKILDPKGLEAASCESYATVKTNFARLLAAYTVMADFSVGHYKAFVVHAAPRFSSGSPFPLVHCGNDRESRIFLRIRTVGKVDLIR